MFTKNTKYRLTRVFLAVLIIFCMVGATQAFAAPAKGVLGALTSPTMPAADSAGGGPKIVETILSFIFDKILGPLLNIVTGDQKNLTDSVGGSKPSVAVKPSPSKDAKPLPSKEAAPKDTANVKPGSLTGKTIIIDPGHGGSNPGAVANGFRESDNNLAVGLKLKDKLVNSGAKVIMTRSADRKVDPGSSTLSQELAARVKIAEENNADIFISLHSNSSENSSIDGAMTFYQTGQERRSQGLAQAIQKDMIKATGARDKGVQTESFHVIRNTTMPSVLVEMGFVSNPAEAELLSDNAYRNKMAQGIYNGVVNYFS